MMSQAHIIHFVCKGLVINYMNFTCMSGISGLKTRSCPSLVKSGCGLSFTMNTMSAAEQKEFTIKL